MLYMSMDKWKMPATPGSKTLADVMGTVTPRNSESIGPAWKEEMPGRWTTLVKPGMMALITYIEVNNVYELALVGKTTSDRVGLFPTKLHAARELFSMMKRTLDDIDKMRGEIWDFIAKHEAGLLR
jgi:hypothetical protein